MDAVVAMVEGVKALGMETCMTLGMLDPEQAARLKQAGLDYYNHNIDTSERYYSRDHHAPAPLPTGWRRSPMSATPASRSAAAALSAWARRPMDRIDMLVTLANLPEPPESVPINMLIPIAGHPARRCQRRSIRSTSSAPSRWPAS